MLFLILVHCDIIVIVEVQGVLGFIIREDTEIEFPQF